MRSANKNQQGIGIVEILVAVAIISSAILGIASLGNFILRLSHQSINNAVAANLAQEGIETTRAVKEESWGTLTAFSADVPYHPIKIGSPLKWSLSSGNEYINGFTRQVTISNVSRDANDDITTSGGTLDPATKKIACLVSWSDQTGSHQIVLTEYLADWKP